MSGIVKWIRQWLSVSKYVRHSFSFSTQVKKNIKSKKTIAWVGFGARIVLYGKCDTYIFISWEKNAMVCNSVFNSRHV